MCINHASAITKVLWSPDGKRVITGAEDGTLRVFEAMGSGELLMEISVGMKMITDMEVCLVYKYIHIYIYNSNMYGYIC